VALLTDDALAELLHLPAGVRLVATRDNWLRGAIDLLLEGDGLDVGYTAPGCEAPRVDLVSLYAGPLSEVA
jgi:hypothetical protein